MGGNNQKKSTFKHVLYENTTFDNLFLDYELHIIGSDEMNHVDRLSEVVNVVAGGTVQELYNIGGLQVFHDAYISFPSLFYADKLYKLLNNCRHYDLVATPLDRSETASLPPLCYQ
jgi:hypothetical protein